LTVFFQQLINGLSLGGIYVLVALGYTMLPILSFDSFLSPQSTALAQSIGLHLDFTNYRFMLYGCIPVGVMRFRPEGLIPSRQRKAEFKKPFGDPNLPLLMRCSLFRLYRAPFTRGASNMGLYARFRNRGQLINTMAMKLLLPTVLTQSWMSSASNALSISPIRHAY
jgi:hypothetical protein